MMEIQWNKVPENTTVDQFIRDLESKDQNVRGYLLKIRRELIFNDHTKLTIKMASLIGDINCYGERGFMTENDDVVLEWSDSLVSFLERSLPKSFDKLERINDGCENMAT